MKRKKGELAHRHTENEDNSLGFIIDIQYVRNNYEDTFQWDKSCINIS